MKGSTFELLCKCWCKNTPKRMWHVSKLVKKISIFVNSNLFLPSIRATPKGTLLFFKKKKKNWGNEFDPRLSNSRELQFSRTIDRLYWVGDLGFWCVELRRLFPSSLWDILGSERFDFDIKKLKKKFDFDYNPQSNSCLVYS